MDGMFLVNEERGVCFMQINAADRICCFRYVADCNMILVSMDNGREEVFTTEVDARTASGLLSNQSVLVIEVDEQCRMRAKRRVPLSQQ